jgi:hypothetical protein
MSATLDAKLFGSFFMGAPCLNVPGRYVDIRSNGHSFPWRPHAHLDRMNAQNVSSKNLLP